MGAFVPPPGQPMAMQPGEFISGTQPRKVAFKTTDLTPPSNLYVTTEEKILINCFTSVATASLKVSFRILYSSGTIVHSEQVFPLVANRSNNQVEIPLQEGFLLALNLAPTGPTAVRRGQMWASAAIELGGVPKGAFVHPLFSDYLCSNDATGWPSGPIRQSVDGPGIILSVAGTAPAAGADFTVTVPVGARWRLQAINNVLTTSATVATRVPEIAITDGVSSGLHRFVSPSTQAASLSVRYTAENGVTPNTNDATQVQVPIGSNIILFQGWNIISSTGALQAGDQWGAPQLAVEEWLEN